MLKSIEKQLLKINIIHIILVSFSIHMFLISQPNFEVVDEVDFTNFMRWFMVNIDNTPYQLPGLSFIIAPFVYLFGDNWFSWRFPIIIFGMVFLYFYYKVIKHISNKKIALLTTIILSASPMIFIHSSLMLRDIPVMALGFMGLYLYFKQRYYFSALIIGLSALIKESAFFFVIFIVLHYVLTNREKILMQAASSLDKQCLGFVKTPLFSILILSASFLIPLTIYENTVTVLEYETMLPEYFFIFNEGEQKTAHKFDIKHTTKFSLESPLESFNYINLVKDPFYHLNLIFTKGYYSNNDSSSNGFVASFLPVKFNGEFVSVGFEDRQLSKISNNIELHIKDFKTIWYQELINYSYWHIAFWGILGLITYAIYHRIKDKQPISNLTLFLILGLVFFIPYLIIDMIRDTFAYYMIYYIPFLACGLITLIYKISNKKIQTIVLCSFLIAIFVNFAYYFPIKFFG